MQNAAAFLGQGGGAISGGEGSAEGVSMAARPPPGAPLAGHAAAVAGNPITAAAMASASAQAAQPGAQAVPGPANAAGTAAQQTATASQSASQGMFARDLRLMMYGFGDCEAPLPETVALVESIVIDYVTDLVHRASALARKRGARVAKEDVMHILRRDPRKYGRALELLQLHADIEAAKKSATDNDILDAKNVAKSQ